MRTAKLFFALVLIVFSLSFFAPASTSAQSVSTPPADLLFHFDDDYFDYGTTNRIDSASSGRSENATIEKSIKKFGSGSLKLNGGGGPSGAAQVKAIFLPGKELVLAQEEFTIDFWAYPLSDYDLNSWYTFFLLDNNRNNKPDDRHIRLWRQTGASWMGVPGYDSNTVRMYVGHREVDVVESGTGEAAPNTYTTRALTIPKDADELVLNTWNHVSIHRKNIGSVSYINLSINGQLGRWRPFVSKSNTATLYNQIIIGDVYPYVGMPFFHGYLDEFRIVKGKALWRDVPDNGTFAVPTSGDYSNTVVDQNKIITPTPETISSHVVSLGNTTDSTESNITYATCPPGSARPSTREEYLTKLDGTPKLTSYFDTNNKLICTTYWAGNATTTTSKKLKRFEYDNDGQITREIYYGVDGASITDTVTYFSKFDRGGRQKEIQNRNGTEYYKRYSTTGRLLYEHEYKNGQYVTSRNFTYDGNGRLSSELIFSSPGKYEKVVYTRNGSGVVTQTDSYRAYERVGTDTANYVHTTSEYTGTVVTKITRTYFDKNAGTPTALRSEIARYNTSGVAIDQRTFDYAQNKQKFSTYITAGTASLLGRLKTDEEWSLTDYSYASSSLAYNTTTGELISWSKVNYDDMSAQGATAGYYWTKYTIYNVKTGLPKEEWTYDRWPSLYLKRQSSIVYDGKGGVSTRRAYDYRDTTDKCLNYSSVCAHTITKYSKDGFVQIISKDNDITGVRTYAENYYGNGEPWYIQNYQYGTPAANQYTINFSRVNYRNSLSTSTASDLVSDGTAVYTNDYVFVSQPVPSDPLGQKKIGDKILANISDASLRGQAQGGAEKLAIRAVLKAILPEYKNALLAVSESDSLKKEKRYEIYVAYASKITRAIYAIEYRFHSGSPKYLNTDTTLDKSVTGWYGVDGTDFSGNTEFWGLYIRPGAVNSADVEAVYVDMNILNPSAVDFAIGISNYDDLKSAPKKIEKWDALRSGTGFSFANNTLSLFNLSGGVGRYITLDEVTKADPTVNLTIDRFEEDMKNSGVVLSLLSETQVIEKMYQYFDKQSYFSYLYDMSQVSQTVNQTLVRKGGDCEDFGLFFLSLLREEFKRLGNTDAISRLGLVTAYVDSSAAISGSNQGAGHASVGFRQGSTYYYIEASYLFLGSGADGTRPTPRVLNPLSVSGSTVAGTIGQSGWYVQAADMYPILGSRVQFTGSLGVFHDTNSQTNSVDTTVAQVSDIYTKLEPYNPLVTTLASSTVQAIPNFKNQSVEFVVESTHSFFNRLTQYVPESGGADVWRGIDQTLPSVINPDGTVNLVGKISGDCEDLAFAEASLLENVLLRYYLAGGAVPENAVNQAKKNIVIVAEKDYGGVAGRSHLYVGFLTPKTDTSPAVVRLIDPQLGTIGAPQLMRDLYNDKYLFFSDREKVSAITPYDWSTLNFSAAVAAAAANGVVLNPGPVDPKAPTKVNLTPTQQAAIINAAVTADPPKPSAFKQFINFVYDKSGLKAIVQSSTVLEFITRVAVNLALKIGGGPIGTVVQLAASAINLAIVGNFDDKGPIPTAEDAGVKVVNGVVTVLGALTKPGGADTPERADAEAALRAGRTVPATPANMDSNNSSATEAAATTRQSGQVIVQRNSNTSVVNAIGPNDTSRTSTTKVYNPVTNVMTITTNTTIVIPQSPITFFRPPVLSCPAGTPVCTGSEGVTIPANAIADGSPSSCYVSGQAPSCEIRQYTTGWVCDTLYDKNTAGTGCTCVDPTATGVSATGECQYGAMISCVGTTPPAPMADHPSSVVTGTPSFTPPAGQPSSTIIWNYDLAATQNNTQCKWSCASGYSLSGGVCVADVTYSCRDTIPPSLNGKAKMCTPSNPDQNSNLNSVLAPSCSDVGSKLCQYTCDTSQGYVYGGNTCVCSAGLNSDGSCKLTPLPTAIRSVNVFATPSTLNAQGSLYSSLDRKESITVNKKQNFKVEWTYGDTGEAGTCSAVLQGPSGQISDYMWFDSDFSGSGYKEGMNFTETGTYIFSVSCQKFPLSNTDSATVIVSPSGRFEEI
jgi:hypothetical protein